MNHAAMEKYLLHNATKEERKTVSKQHYPI